MFFYVNFCIWKNFCLFKRKSYSEIFLDSSRIASAKQTLLIQIMSELQ